MRVLALVVIAFWAFQLGERFVAAKIKNDTQIAADTKRIADALEAKTNHKENN